MIQDLVDPCHERSLFVQTPSASKYQHNGSMLYCWATVHAPSHHCNHMPIMITVVTVQCDCDGRVSLLLGTSSFSLVQSVFYSVLFHLNNTMCTGFRSDLGQGLDRAVHISLSWACHSGSTSVVQR